jgi:hypothetical protein
MEWDDFHPTAQDGVSVLQTRKMGRANPSAVQVAFFPEFIPTVRLWSELWFAGLRADCVVDIGELPSLAFVIIRLR